MLFLIAAAMIVGTLAYGPLDRLWGRRQPVVVFGAAGTALVFILLGLAGAAPLGLTAVLLALLAFIGAYSVTVMAHGVALFPKLLVGRGVAILHVALNCGTALLQAITGEIVAAFTANGASAASSYSALFLFLGGVTIAALLAYTRVYDPAPVSLASQSGE